jgi:methylenetetrahydrofolate dehydrogenase (NADP+)/methenyltetrahydrofolate cyclohydrolase
MAQLLDGKKVAESIYSKLLLDASLLSVVPKLAVILVGNNPASQTYVRSKAKKAQSLGLRSETIIYPETVTQEELLNKIRELNSDKDTHGVLIQLPLPAHIRKEVLLDALDPKKDVDGLTAQNSGMLLSGRPQLVPCTPLGVIEMLRFYSISMDGAQVVVLGRSDIVGKPMSLMLLNENATVTMCHSKTKNIEAISRAADIVIAAIGKPKIVGPKWVREGTVVIDVGIHRVGDKLCGDVDYNAVEPLCKAISPVPGGVGPMTIAILMRNLVLAASLQSQKNSPH